LYNSAIRMTNRTRLSGLDRWLPLLILAAMLLGVAIAHWAKELQNWLQHQQVGTTHVGIAIGLILMLYPPLAKVNYHRLFTVLGTNRRLVYYTLLLNWLVAPTLIIGLAALLVPDNPAWFNGMVLIGMAPCIAMVLVWIELGRGDRELAAGLVALNSVLQIVFYAPMVVAVLWYVPPMLGMAATRANIAWADVAQSVGLYLGVPFALGLLSSTLLRRALGDDVYTNRYLPRISKLTPVFLLLTIVLMFSQKGEELFRLPVDVLRVALPLVLFFVVQFGLAWAVARWRGATYPKAVTVAFTASGNNFELGLATAIGVFGISSPEAFVGVIGPLVEVPVLLLLARLVLRSPAARPWVATP
jgi:ACR3 family arsenite transporter